MSFNSQRPVLWGGLVALTVVVGILAWYVCIPYYYTWRLNSAWAQVLAVPADAEQGEHLRRFDYYRDRLVELGWLEKRVIRLNYIPVPSEEANRLWKLLTDRFPSHGLATMSGYDPDSTNAITVWEKPSMLAEWEQAIRGYDQPNYRELLSTSEPAGL